MDYNYFSNHVNTFLEIFLKIFYITFVTKEEDMKLYKKLKEIRESINMTQGEFSKKIGFSRIALAHWEQNLKTPRFDAMIEIYKLAKKKGIYITFEDFV